MIAAAGTVLTNPSHCLPPRAAATIVLNGCTLAHGSIDAVLMQDSVDQWLSDRERRDAAQLRDTRRHRAWLSGRLLLKRRLVDRLSEDGSAGGVHPSELEIISHNDAGRPARPAALLDGQPLDFRLSIAHTDHQVLVAVAPAHMAVGVDLVDAQFAPGNGFMRLWFTAAERQQLCKGAAPSAAAIWAVKEAVYKAINRGEPFIPQQMEVGWQSGRPLICHAANPLAERCCLATWLTAEGDIAALATLDQLTMQSGACHDD